MGRSTRSTVSGLSAPYLICIAAQKEEEEAAAVRMIPFVAASPPPQECNQCLSSLFYPAWRSVIEFWGNENISLAEFRSRSVLHVNESYGWGLRREKKEELKECGKPNS